MFESETYSITGDILDQIRVRPGMYLGETSLSALYHFLRGYSLAEGQFGSHSDRLPRGFHDWVAYRLHYLESTAGYRNMILRRIPDESAALDKFFELLDEWRARKAKVVATISAHPRQPDGGELGNEEDKRRVAVAETAQIITYTRDPGLFLVSDDDFADNHFYPSLSWIGAPYKPESDYVTVLDQEEFARLHREALIFEDKRGESQKREEEVASNNE